MTSIYSLHEYRSEDRSRKFTAHAAVQFRKRYNSRFNGAAAGQLLQELNNEDSEKLKRLVHKTFPTCNVNLIHAVNAPQMYGIYLLRKEEMRLTHEEYCDKELILYHVTTKSRALESLKSGLDWRRTHRSKFGCGVSFSDDADYANYYADKSPNEDSQVIIVCAVLVNKTHRVSEKLNKINLIIPPDNADTTVSPNGRVYVKYDNYDFYPLYLIYYQQTPEHLNESKYFRNNPNNERQQNNQIIQQQQQEQQAQREQKQAQHELRQAQREKKQVQRKQKQAQRMQEPFQKQTQRMQEQEQRMQEQGQRMQELVRKQVQLARKQGQLAQKQGQRMQEHFRKLTQRVQEQGQRIREQGQRMREQTQRMLQHNMIKNKYYIGNFCSHLY